MKRILRTLAPFSLAFIVIYSFFCFFCHAAPTPEPPAAENVRAACLYDKTHGKMLISENASSSLQTSTSAKVMMGYLACELLSDRLDETVTLTDTMLGGVGGYSMKLKAGERIKVIDLLYGAICGSYNDAGYVLAHICSDSADAFVSLMNERAHALGASSTSYTNPLGYPDSDGMRTTAADTVKVALAASENSLYMEISSAKSHAIAATNMSGERVVYNRNALISSRSTQKYYDPRCSGMNSGISGEGGGWSIVTLAKDDGAEYILVLLGGSESADGSEIYAYETANTLIDWACNTYNSYRIFTAGQMLGKAEISMTSFGSEAVEYSVAEDLYIYIPDRSSPEIRYSIDYIPEKLAAPIKAGETIGTVSVYSNGELVGEGSIVLSADCEANILMVAISALGEYTKSRAFIATLIFIALILPVAILIKKERMIRRGHTRRY